jgi:hypothetical protein
MAARLRPRFQALIKGGEEDAATGRGRLWLSPATGPMVISTNRTEEAITMVDDTT